MKIIKNRKMKGTVLLTVVSIMTLMIIFMTTTLVLANAANKRAHRSYSASQAEYTARAAIESFTTAMSRDPGIVAAVQNMLGTEHPEVIVSGDSGSLGYVGYYDSSGTFVKDHIVVEKVGDNYVRTDLTGTGEQWEKVDVIKISATARVGKEEKTVSAYINKKGSNQTAHGSKVKGLNTAGNGKFPNGEVVTGGLGLGLDKFVPGSYAMRNVMTLDTPVAFVNGSLDARTSTFKVVANTYNSETIIMGDFNVANDELVTLNYTVPAGMKFTQQKTPYFFCLGKLTCEDKFMVKKKDSNDRPYNVFAGSCKLDQNNSEINADLYLMNAGETSYVGKETVSSALYNWAESLVDGGTQFKSHGGSIYSRGDLVLGGMEINGNVQVDGNVTLLCTSLDVNIHGNLVVGGTITITDDGGPNPGHGLHVTGGKIYCNNPITGTPKEGTVDTLDNWKTLNGGASATPYPASMTRDAILGTINPTSGEVTPADPSTKIVRTLDEVREDLGYDKLNGGFASYVGEVSELGTDAENQTGYNDSTSYISSASGTINSSCTITGFGGDVTIDTSSNEVVVVLKGLSTSTKTYWDGDLGANVTVSGVIDLGGHTITVTGPKDCKFFVDGTLCLDNGNIVYGPTHAKTAITYQEQIPIEFYGKRTSLDPVTSAEVVNSRIMMQNNCQLMGSFKMPWTDFDVKNMSKDEYGFTTYTSDTGTVYNNVKPAIVGNALFRDLLDTQNKFQMCYTEAGSGSSSGGTISTALGYYDIGYFSGS